MTIKYVKAFDTNGGTDAEACLQNCKIVAEGLAGVPVYELRYPNKGECMDYGQLAPWSCVLSWAEVYVNGAKNFIVQNGDGVTVGYIIVRPLTAITNSGIISTYSVDN